ncbi:Dabb family protein [Myxococcota bacterium]|nr:Dabb family protein [Myxococcota bacterium]
MQRRFEMYRLRDDVDPKIVHKLERILRGCGRFIPEVLDSATGRSLGEADVTLVWENAYESAESYSRYMRHPYHICILDRYLLPESPQCILAGGEPGVGLMGYEIDTPLYRRTRGIRRVVALRVSANSEPDQLTELEQALTEASSRFEELELSIVARNSMGQEWFPGVFTHIWEQAFENEEALERFLGRDESLPPEIEHSVSVHYAIETEPM